MKQIRCSAIFTSENGKLNGLQNFRDIISGHKNVVWPSSTSLLRAMLRVIFIFFLTVSTSFTAAKNDDNQTLDDDIAAPSSADKLKNRRIIEEIIVTARRTEENLQDVPIAISVIGEQAIAEQNITDGYDLSRASPGLSTIETGDRTTASYSIRGKGEAFIGSAPGVVPYYADVPQFSPFFYDLDSIQVLKGPQGTLFGRNTTGGAILITPKKPDDNFSGYLMTRVGNYSRFDKEFAVGGPIVEEFLSYRIAGQYLRRDGYTENLANGVRLDDEHRESYRASLIFKPFDGFENYTLYQRDNIDENGSANILVAFVDDPANAYADQMGPFIEKQRARGPRKVEHDKRQKTLLKNHGIINTTTWELNQNYTLKNIYSYLKKDIIGTTGNNTDADGSPFRKLHAVSVEPNSGYNRTNELQFLFDNHDNFSAVFGVYYENNVDRLSKVKAELSVGVAPMLPLDSPPIAVPLDIIVTSASDDTSTAGFLQGTWDFLKDWSLTLGVRHTYDRRVSSQGATAGDGAPTNLPSGVPLLEFDRRVQEFKASSWNLALGYKVTPDILTYLTVRRGYKAGGFNLTVELDELTYEPEFVDSAEIGMKSEWFIGGFQIRANVVFYYDDYTDIQRLVTSNAPTGGFSTRNAAAATVMGGDLDLLIAFSEWLEVVVQYTNLQTEYDEFLDKDFGDLSDSRFVNSPEHQLLFKPVANFTLPNDWGRLSVQTPIFYQSEYAIHALNTPNGNPNNDVSVPTAIKPGFTRYDVRLDWREILGYPFSAGIYVRNLTDKEAEMGGQPYLSNPIVGIATSIYNAPRTYHLELRYDF